MQSTANDLASRLYQATIPSSEQHQQLSLYGLPPQPQVFYHFSLQNILLANSRGESRERVKANAKTGLREGRGLKTAERGSPTADFRQPDKGLGASLVNPPQDFAVSCPHGPKATPHDCRH
jgi:hypothetical protein